MLKIKLSFLLFFSFAFFSAEIHAENKRSKEIKEKIRQFSNPIDEVVICDLVTFINRRLSTQTDKLRAVIAWIANNFEYDIENIFAYDYYGDPQELIDHMLKNRKGICVHFAYLFSEIANRLGIKTYVITGYTIQRGLIDTLSHAWTASFVNSTWLLTDPTWTVGHIEGHEFIKAHNDAFFLITPENLIRTHMPFDPLWQFLHYPISHQEFYEGVQFASKNNPFFNYADTLKLYENSTKLEQLISTLRRIERSIVGNTLAVNQLFNIQRQMEAYENRIVVARYNVAVVLYNDGVAKLNNFIDGWSRQLFSQKSQAEVRGMVKSIEKLLINSLNGLQEIETTDINTKKSIAEFKVLVEGTLARTNDLSGFIDNYFNARNARRQ